MTDKVKLADLKTEETEVSKVETQPLTKSQAKQPREPRERSRQRANRNSQTQSEKVSGQKQQPEQNPGEASEQEIYPEEEEMMNVLGFSSFASTKKKDHTKSSVQAVFKNSSVARKYRQYMNRPGNFNRKLDAM